MLSIVVPAYNEDRNLDVLLLRLQEVLGSAPLEAELPSWEVIFVDDGSSDGTWGRIVELNARDPHVRGVRLSRNFGHQSALMAGLAAARGRAIVMMDADLQHPPELIPDLLAKWKEGFKIVHALRRDPPTVSAFKRATSRLYYKLFTFLSGVAIEEGAADFRLLDRQVLDEILGFQEEGLFLRGIVHWVGYDTASVVYESCERHAGASKYSLRKMLTLGWHGVSSFSLVPLRIGIAIGLLSSTIAFLGVAYAIIGKWLDDQAVPGWASSVAISSFLFGVLFVFLAILAEYVGRIVVEVRRRPRFLVRDTTRAATLAGDRRNKPAVLADYRDS
ncbi:MAG TPA: glycosyltransferase family 2 protein [Gammaproteobacteria bacterium]|nr:glycosyltransferase family 2 protein [Gammaproteobacteria bacterium]